MDSPQVKKRNTILRRFMVMSWLVAVMSVIAFAFVMVRYQRQSIQQELGLRAKSVADGIEDDLGYQILRREKDSLVIHCLRALEKNRDVKFLVLAWPDGESLTFFHQNQFRDPQLTGDWINGGAMEEPARITEAELPEMEKTKSLLYSRLCTTNGISSGWIHVGMGLDSYESSVRGVYTTTGLVGTVTLILGGLAAWFFARNLTMPLHKLQVFAYKVATGALNARATVNSEDEIGDLADSINRMVETIEQSQMRLRESVKTEAAAREKEILLREIHHRVKNNMQILTSLLRLQTRRANSEEMRIVLMESEARIRSMGLLHEKLYQSESVSTIELQGYLRTLTNELLRMNSPPGKRREIKLSVRDIFLGLDTALPCGLIVTELVSNALKYAFPDRAEGIIYVSVGKEADGEFTLVVWDNGVGIPPGFDPAKSQSLGMRLVSMLVDQLNGKATLSSDQGTRWEIRFKETQYKVRL